MAKTLYITEKPSVAADFAAALHISTSRKNGYIEGGDTLITWCVGHLVTMSYPEAYDPALKKWQLDTLPFLPSTYRYEVIPSAKKQFDVVASLLKREDVETIYVCTDSGREGEYIYRLVDQMVGVKGKKKKRVWIDSQTEEEILRGIREAKDLSAYDNLSDAAYLRAKEDYLMGINFSRLLTLKYGNSIANYLKKRYAVISVGRVMTCVLGMIVRREREIRDFQKTPFFRINADFVKDADPKGQVTGEWKLSDTSAYRNFPGLYRENGFLKREDAKKLADAVTAAGSAVIRSTERKKEKKQPPMLFNLAELQNTCAKVFKISPDETLRVVQELYEKKLVTYPRTDARVLSTAVAKEIEKNIRGLFSYTPCGTFARAIVEAGSHKGIAKTKYTDDKKITDHYAIIPTGQGLAQLDKLPHLSRQVYETIVRRFLSIFYPPAVYQKTAVQIDVKTGEGTELFASNFRSLIEEGYLAVAFARRAESTKEEQGEGEEDETQENANVDSAFLQSLKKGMTLAIADVRIKEGETTPPKRYNSGAMILAMENAGQLIEDEDLRAQIKGSGIGTSATRAEILKKLVTNGYINLNKKTQIYSPTLYGEMIYDVVRSSIKSLLDPALTASWEKGLSYVEAGTVTEEEYMEKLTGFVTRMTNGVKQLHNERTLRAMYDAASKHYRKP